MKGFVLCVAVALGVIVSNVVVGQQATTPSPTPVVIDGSVAPAAPVTTTSTSSAGECCCKPTFVGMSRHAVRQTVCRGRQTVQTLWSKRPHLRRCRCC